MIENLLNITKEIDFEDYGSLSLVAADYNGDTLRLSLHLTGDEYPDIHQNWQVLCSEVKEDSLSFGDHSDLQLFDDHVLLWPHLARLFGGFQSCILTCGAIVERCLKLQYEEVNGALPSGSHWTLGRCIRECVGMVSKDVLDLAQSMLEPRNNRAHALLEHSDPDLALIGGAERGIEILSSRHYLVEPYRGDARKVILATYKILSALYGSPRRV